MKKARQKANKIMEYSMQLAMLGQLRTQGLIDEKEYAKLKSDLMKDYGIISDLLAI